VKQIEHLPHHSTDSRLERRFINPSAGWQEDYDRIYNRNQLEIGSPQLASELLEQYLREQPRTIIFGGQLGDEGKGRFVDNEISGMLQLSRVKRVMVLRYQGGSNAGHTVEHGDKKLALHQVPSGVFYAETIGIMDTGMVVNVGDLHTEIEYIEDAVGDTREKVFLSDQAIHNTDLERALEWHYKNMISAAEGGTDRGIGPSYAGHYDRTGLQINKFIADDWRKTFGERYDRIADSLNGLGIRLADIEVPDFKATFETQSKQIRKVGTKEEFLDRLESERDWLIQRNMVTDTIAIHEKIFVDAAKGVLFEGSQAVGLDAWIGTYPDTTSSNTTASGVLQGTQFWKKDALGKRMAVIKHNPSSVGVRRMPGHIDLPKKWDEPLPADATPYQEYAYWAQRKAHEVGTTTGRMRDMNMLDLPFLAHTLHLGDANCIGVTHLDVAREDMSVPVIVSYKSKSTGEAVRFKPNMDYLKDEVEAEFIELPGWDGEACARATSFDELPENAKRYLAFIQARTGCPIVAVTTGTKRDNMIEFVGSRAA
jgi:adenylosuccinate synthase